MSSLNRKLRRQIQRRDRMSTKEFRDEIVQTSQEVYQRLAEEQRRHIVEEDSKNGAKIMYLLFGLILHREFGFGQKRIMKAYDAIDAEMASWSDGQEGTERVFDRLIRQVKDETGIDIVMD